MNPDILATVNDALISGMDGLVLSGGERLTADRKPDSIDKVSDDVLPFLLCEVGRLHFEPWQHWEDLVSWDISATLKIKSEPGDVDRAILGAIFDVVAQAKRLTGLPVDKTGKTIPYGPTTQRLFETNQLRFLVERGAPYIKNVSARPADGAYGVADLVIHLEKVVDMDPRGKLPRASSIVLGVSAPRDSIAADTSLPDPYGIAVVSNADAHAWGGYNMPDPLTGSTATQSSAGPPPWAQIRSVAVSPGSASLSSGSSTAQLTAIAFQVNWASTYVTDSAQWSSSDTSVVTVSASGLVTRVAAGSATVSCTYQGVASNAVAITCT